MAPAQMHNAPAGSPEYFVGTNGIGSNGTPFSSSALRVTTMTNVTLAAPIFRTVIVGVSSYGNGPIPDAFQPGDPLNNTNRLHIGDTGITNAAWRDNHLVATQTARSGGKGVVRWYEMRTNDRAVTLIQSGSIDPGPGTATYFPRIEISARLDIGLTYNESSAVEFLSTYVAARTAQEPSGFMETPRLAHAGEATYIDGAYVLAPGSPFLPGTYTGIAVDPANPATFWAIGIWASAATAIIPPSPRNNWATTITQFSVSPAAANQVRIFSPVRWTVAFDQATGLYTYSGTATFLNTLNIVNGTFILVFDLPDPSVVVLTPGGALNVATNQLSVIVNGTFVAGQVLRFPIIFTAPRKVTLPTFYLSGFSDII